MASSMGSGYDYSVATFSPDGKVFQVEYASKTIDNTGLIVGGIVSDGLVLAVDKNLPSPLMVETTATRIFKIANHAICAVAGSLPDARQLVIRARSECNEYEKIWGIPIPGSVLAERMGLFVHGYTAIWSTRPFGCAIVLGVAENTIPRNFTCSGPHKQSYENQQQNDFSLWLIDPTGAAFKYRATAVAKGAAGAKGNLEKLQLDQLNLQDTTKEFAKIVALQHEENVREKSMTIEMIRLNKNGICEFVPEHELDVAKQEAQTWLDGMDA